MESVISEKMRLSKDDAKGSRLDNEYQTVLTLIVQTNISTQLLRELTLQNK